MSVAISSARNARMEIYAFYKPTFLRMGQIHKQLPTEEGVNNTECGNGLYLEKIGRGSLRLLFIKILKMNQAKSQTF